METVIKCEKVKDWTNKEGKAVPIFFIGLSDGQGGESFGQEIPLGTPMDQLKLDQGQYGMKIKWNKPSAGAKGAPSYPNTYIVVASRTGAA